MTEQITLADRYRLEDIIGRGGMAEVWRASDSRLDRQVAVKRLRPDLASDPVFQARFQREAQSAAGLNHPNIVAVYDTGAEVDPTNGISVPYIVMELVQGETLREMMRRGVIISPTRSFEYVTGVLDALGFSHGRGIVHRDIKPANVMITTDGQVKVMDFGIARAVSDSDATMTQTAAVIGTAQYLSPEQARGETVDARSDIYAVGCLLYELLTGRPPFTGDSPVSVAYQHVREIAAPPSQLNVSVTAAMDAIVMKALQKSPTERYQDAAEMLEDITRMLSGEPVRSAVPRPAAAAAAGAIAAGAATGNAADAVAAVSDAGAPRAQRGMDADETRLLPAAETDGSGGLSTLGGFSAQMVDENEEYEPERRRMSPATFILIGLLLALFAALGVVLFKIWGSTSDMVTVPTLIGYNEAGAKSVVSNEKLTPEVVHVSGDAETKGLVIDQDPKGGVQVQIGATVKIVINDGPDAMTIPDTLMGMTLAQAKRELTTLGFTAVTSQDAEMGTEPLNYMEGQVTGTQPAVGTTVKLTDPIIIFTATGKSMMPNLIGMTEEEARDAATEAGFLRVYPVTEESDEKPGTVIKQIPQPLLPAMRTDYVTITIAIPRPATPDPPPTTEPPTSPPTTGQTTEPPPTEETT
ncbi:MAG: Stk1 family PASTA domain-containing Ser/Thr kinase [Propionibacteriaceae bacterium]|jgi:serine/threonine-protein kinase|nr:Stk1 family PASTA domain-containing Ser/Thr kinase [Propionibacteriaceae bacterium]